MAGRKLIFRTRFAPSPTGHLHLGHAYSALLAHGLARAADGQFMLRIENLDTARCRPEYEAAIFEDLEWLGIRWDGPVWRQSEHADGHEAGLRRLADMGVVYPCSCRRSDIRAALSAPQEGVSPPQVYPGLCRGRSMASRRPGDALRLDIAAGLKRIDGDMPLRFRETDSSGEVWRTVTAERLHMRLGDQVVGRKEGDAASYVLASAIDDDAQGITHVTRGEDLFDIGMFQVLLQHLLGLPTPVYRHHRLIRDENGRRLAKRDDARAVRKFRAEGMTPRDVRQMIGL